MRPTSLARLVATTLVVSACVALGGCASDGEHDPGLQPAAAPAASASAWNEPARYSYSLYTTCGERSGLGYFKLWVENGSVVKAKKLEPYSDLTALRLMPTIGDIATIAERAREHGADDLRVVTTPSGRPHSVSIDYDSNAIDDEACYRITDFKAA